MSTHPGQRINSPIPNMRRHPRPTSGIPSYLAGRPNVMYLDRYRVHGRPGARRP